MHIVNLTVQFHSAGEKATWMDLADSSRTEPCLPPCQALGHWENQAAHIKSQGVSPES